MRAAGSRRSEAASSQRMASADGGLDPRKLPRGSRYNASMEIGQKAISGMVCGASYIMTLCLDPLGDEDLNEILSSARQHSMQSNRRKDRFPLYSSIARKA